MEEQKVFGYIRVSTREQNMDRQKESPQPDKGVYILEDHLNLCPTILLLYTRHGKQEPSEPERLPRSAGCQDPLFVIRQNSMKKNNEEVYFLSPYFDKYF